MEKTFEKLTLEEKADFVAGLLNSGLADYFDTCKKIDGGNYEYTNADAFAITGKAEIFTAAGLLASTFAQWGEKFFADEYNRRNGNK